MHIYTRTGDRGETSLFGGKRVLKSDELVDAYGSIDELNSWVGMVTAHIDIAEVREFLNRIQGDLFVIGSTLAGWKTDITSLSKRVDEMESRIDVMEKELPELKNFILPGGSRDGAFLHIVRGTCRRVERQMVKLAQKEPVDPLILKYLNRLSDLFFMLARFINKHAGVEEIVWSGIPRASVKK